MTKNGCFAFCFWIDVCDSTAVNESPLIKLILKSAFNHNKPFRQEDTRVILLKNIIFSLIRLLFCNTRISIDNLE